MAVILEVDEAVGLCGTVLLSRHEAERRLFGDQLDDRLRKRETRRTEGSLRHRGPRK
jgi:hypothetical protein